MGYQLFLVPAVFQLWLNFNLQPAKNTCRVTVAHPNSYPHFPTASIHTTILQLEKYCFGISSVYRDHRGSAPSLSHVNWSCLLGFFFLNWALSSRATGSTLYITAHTTSRETFSSWTCLSFLRKAPYPRRLPGPSICCLTAVSAGANLKPGNRKPESGAWNQNPESESGIRNPESGIHKSKKTSSSNLRKLFCIALAGKN